MTTNREFLKLSAILRESDSLDAFTAKMPETEQFAAIASAIMENTTRWGESIGIGKPKVVEDINLSPEEKKWEKYFKDHSFGDMGSQRNIADLIELLTDIPVTKFIKALRTKNSREFPGYIVIVPVGNSNSHNYTIGKPIMSLSGGTIFYKENGSHGNSMEIASDDYRLPTIGEVYTVLAGIMYRLDSMAENICYDLIPGFTLD